MLQSTRVGSAGALAATLILAASALAGAQTTETKDLAWKLEKGSKHQYSLNWQLSLGQSVRAAQNLDLVDFQIQVAYTLDQEVTEVTEGVASIKATFKTIKASVVMNAMGMPGAPEEFDSEAEGGSELLQALGKAIGESFTFKMDAQGKVTEVKGGTEVQQKLAAALEEAAQKQDAPPNPMGIGGAQTAGMSLLAFEDGSIESALNLLNNVLPGAEGGESWTKDHEQKTKIGTMKFVGKYRLGEASPGKTQISFKNKGDVTMEKGDSSGPGLAQMVKDLKVVESKVKGLASFGAGHILSSEVEFLADAEGIAPEMLKKRLEMMMGGGGGEMKLGLKYGLKLSYERKGESKQSDF